MNEIDIECASANQLQASAIPCVSGEIFLVGSEISEADDGSRKSGNQIGYIFNTIDWQNCRPYDDSSEQADQNGSNISVVRQMDKSVKMLSDKGAEPEEDDMSDLYKTQET